MTTEGPGAPAPVAVTLTSLAKELGVHVSTVSRALSSTPTGIAPATVASVRRLAEERGYRSNHAARALRTGRSHAVGMVVPRLTDEVMATVYGGVDEVGIGAGYTTLVANTLNRPDLRDHRLDLMLSQKVEGVVVADSFSDSNVVEQLEAARVPYVLALRRLPGQLSIGIDDLRGGRLVAEHLLSLGHVRLGVVAGDTRASTGAERARGFLETCAEAGVRVPRDAVVPCTFDVRAGAGAAARVLEADPEVTAIFAASDNVALGVLGTLRDSGRSVPDDVALAGYNDLDMAAALPAPLTSVDSHLMDVGRNAMRALLELIDGGSPSSRLHEPGLVVRASTTGRTVQP